VKRQPKGPKPRAQSLRVWTFSEAQAAIPYIASVVRSIREHALEALAHARVAQRIANRPGRPNREALISHEEAAREARESDEEFRDAVAELQALDIYCLDPIQGQALVPFVHDEQLAWYIFDLHEPQAFRFWRFQSDPEDTRRPITVRQKDAAAGATRTV
jgi:hypothetical protein